MNPASGGVTTAPVGEILCGVCGTNGFSGAAFIGKSVEVLYPSVELLSPPEAIDLSGATSRCFLAIGNLRAFPLIGDLLVGDSLS